MSAYDTRDKVLALGIMDAEIAKVNARNTSRSWLH
jgi:hypothetical protein